MWLEVLFLFYASLVLNCFTKSPFALKHAGRFHGSIWRTGRNIIGVGFQSQLKIHAFFFFFFLGCELSYKNKINRHSLVYPVRLA